MQKEIHPTYFHDARVTCACGNSFQTGSTVQEIHVEICSNCHPFYTGKQKYIDTAGRVDRFKKLQGAKAAAKRVTKREKGLMRKALKKPKAEKEPQARTTIAERTKKARAAKKNP